MVWITVTIVAEIPADRGVKLYIHPLHNNPGDITASQRPTEAPDPHKHRSAGV
jgi:hypothetical protein